MYLKAAVRIGKKYQNPVPTEVGGLSTIFKVGPRFFTGTAAEVTPIREVDNRKVGEPGPITKRLQARYFDLVKGSDTSHPEWLTRV